MPDGTDLFEEAFGSAHEDEADDIEEPTQAKRKTSGAEKTDAQKASARTETASADDSAQSDLVPLKERSKKTRKPRVKKESPKKEAPVIESREHREAIKKMVLQKATQAARGDADEAEEDDAADEEDADTDDTDGGSGSDTNEDDSRAKGTPKRKTGKDDAADAEESETDDSDGDFLEHMDSDDWLREEGTQEEGISAKKTGASDDGGAPKTTRPLTPTASDVALKFLEDDAKHIAFIGRKKSVFKQYGDTAALFVGRVEEPSDPQSEKHIYLDSLNPHVVFVCGARGSGKSYVLGVIAEELALKNKDVGAIVVDPIGVFWSMRFPNKEEKEVQSLGSWGIMPQGLDNLKVFIPRGIAASVPKSTFDGTFAIQPSLLTVEDWCLTFNIERFSPTGLLMEKALTKVRDGFTDTDEKKIKPKGSAYGLDDMVYCLEKDNELNSRDRGYKQDSIRALVSRFEAAKNWGIFDQKGTPLGELSRQNQLTILDTSFLEDNVTALVIGVLARRILAARKLSARKEAAKRLKTVSMDELLELDIPPTWLFIDEAHTLIPSGNVSTPATSALVEYVKQGRRPGCSLVFATQQPSAIDSRVLSQLDVLIAHKLVFDDDIKAVYKRAPTIITPRYKNANFIKTLPVGVGLTADRREETTRAFVMRIRPRMSQHEGRDAETAQAGEALSVDQVEGLAAEMLFGKLSVEGEVELDKARMVIETLNLKYRSKVAPDKVFGLLQKKKVVVTEDALVLPGVKKDEDDEETDEEADEAHAEGDEESAHEEDGGDAQRVSLAEMKGKGKKKPKGGEMDNENATDAFSSDQTELISFPIRVTEQRAHTIASGKAKGGMLGLFGKKEEVRSVLLKHDPVYRVSFEVPKNNAWVGRTCFVSAVTGEFLHFGNGAFEESKGAAKLLDLDETETRLLLRIAARKGSVPDLAKATALDEDSCRKAVKRLVSTGLVDVSDKGGALVYFVSKDVELPPSPLHPKLDSLAKMPFERIDTLSKSEEKLKSKDASELVEKLFVDARVRNVETVYRPVYEAVLARDNARRALRIDGYNGKIL